jgi:hypothetical protein
VLAHLGDGDSRFQVYGASVRLDVSGEYPEEGGLAGAVRAYDADLFARVEKEFGVLQDSFSVELSVKPLRLQELDGCARLA